MDTMQIAIPVVGIIAAAAVTFYSVIFAELREKLFQDLDDSDETEQGSYKFSVSSREKLARRKRTEPENLEDEDFKFILDILSLFG